MYCEIWFPVISRIWENKSGAVSDPHPFWTWWYLIYTLLSATFQLNVRIIWLDPFYDWSFYYVICICNHCLWTNWNGRSMMGLTSHLSCISDAFSSFAFLFLWRRVWQWWVWFRVIWYVRFYILLWGNGEMLWRWFVHFSIFSGEMVECSGKYVGRVSGVGYFPRSKSWISLIVSKSILKI